MVKTQVYLTEEESSAIMRLSQDSGHAKSALIRQAVDEFIQRRDTTHRIEKLRSAKGMWAGREDLPDVRELRTRFDRY